VATQKTLKAKKGKCCYFERLWDEGRDRGGLWDEGRHGQKMKNFWEKISKILILNISASAPSI
jgi:hypothetical protein